MKINSTYAISFNRNYYNNEKAIDSYEKSTNKVIPHQPITLSNSAISKAMKNIALFSLPVALTCSTGCYYSPTSVDHPIGFAEVAMYRKNVEIDNIKIENIKPSYYSLIEDVNPLLIHAKINGKPAVFKLEQTKNSIIGNLAILQDDNSLKKLPIEIKAKQQNLFEAKVGEQKATILYGDGKCKILDDKGKEIKNDFKMSYNIPILIADFANSGCTIIYPIALLALFCLYTAGVGTVEATVMLLGKTGKLICARRGTTNHRLSDKQAKPSNESQKKRNDDWWVCDGACECLSV